MSDLSEQLKELGRTIESCAEPISILMDNIGSEITFDDLPTKWRFLESHEFVSGNYAIGYRATPLLIDVVTSLSLQSNRQKVAPDVDNWLNQINKQVEYLLECMEDQNYKKYDRHLLEIKNLTWNMTYGLLTEINIIDHYIQTEFGHVVTLKEKKIENKYCIKHIKNYTEKLLYLNEKTFIRIAKENSDLTQIFLYDLMPEVHRCRDQFIQALPKLEKLLWTYRQHDKAAKNIWALSHHLNQGGKVIREFLSDEELLNSPFNMIEKEDNQAYVCMDENEDTSKLIDIVKTMTLRSQITIDEVIIEEIQEQKIIFNEETDVEEIEECFLKNYLFEFGKDALKSRISAALFWMKKGDSSVPLGVWLIWLQFELEQYKGRNKVHIFSQEPATLDGSMLIKDFEVEFIINKNTGQYPIQ